MASDGNWYPPELHPNLALDSSKPEADWWMASDGNWYPPEVHPDFPDVYLSESVSANLSEPDTNKDLPATPTWFPPSEPPENSTLEQAPVGQHQVSPGQQTAYLSQSVLPMLEPAIGPGQVAGPIALPINTLVPSSSSPTVAPYDVGSVAGLAGNSQPKDVAVSDQFVLPIEQTGDGSANADHLWNLGEYGSADAGSGAMHQVTYSVDYRDYGLTFVITGFALLVIYVALLLEVLAHNDVLGLAIIAPLVAAAFTVRTWVIRTKALKSGIVTARIGWFLNIAIGLRILCIVLSIWAIVARHS